MEIHGKILLVLEEKGVIMSLWPLLWPRWRWRSECEYTLHTDFLEKCYRHLKWRLHYRVVFTRLGFLNLNSSGRCNDKRFAASMYVIVVMRVNSPWRFLLFVDTSFQMTYLESSLVFTFLGLLIPNALQASARQNHTLPSFTITLSVWSGDNPWPYSFSIYLNSLNL